MKKIMIANGKYTAKDGQEKSNWVELGVIMTSQAGKEFVLLDPTVNLAGFMRETGKDKLIASIFDGEQKPRASQQTQQYAQQPAPIGQPAPIATAPNGAPVVMDEQLPF